MNLPDRIFSIGGAGKEITFVLLESEWVLREVLQPRRNPQTVRVTILDTAEEEENSDRQRIQDIRETIAELKSELRDTNAGRLGDITIEYKQITKKIQLNDQNDLIGERAVPRITAGTGMQEEDWWVEEEHINENLDFATGVVRKRGLGKAIYYKAYAEDDELSTFIDLPDKGKVAVFAGLGGGTGSGIIIDLARHLKKKQRTAEITLFGILPNHTEGVRESANAYAVLSELEYLSLTDDQVFKDRVLLPIDPTGFDGKGGNKIQNAQLLRELDEAIIYLVAAYYNTIGSEDPFADSPTFAPFTIGIPQVLRYNVEAINEARTALREILNAKQDAVQAELEIYSQIERFLENQYGSPSGDGLRELDRADLNERIDDFRDLLAFELFNELEYESVSIFEDIITDAIKEGEDIAEQIDIISGSLRAVDTTGRRAGTFVDNIDEHLAEVLESDLRAICMRKELLIKKQSVDDNRVRDAVEYLVNSGDGSGNPGVKLNRLENKLTDLENQRERLENELEESIEELERRQQEQSDRVQQKVTDWERQIKPAIDQLQQTNVESVENALSSLQRELENYRTQVVNAAEAEEIGHIPTQAVEENLNYLDNELGRCGVDFQSSRSSIEASLSALKEARKAFLTLNRQEGTIEKLAPWTGKTEKAKDEAHRNYRIQKNKLDDTGVFSIGPPGSNFAAEIRYNGDSIVRDLQHQKQDLQAEIVDGLQKRTTQLPESLQREMESELDRGADPDRLRQVAKRVFESELEGTRQVREQKSSIESELRELEHRLDTYESTTSLFKDLNQRRDIYADNVAKFHEHRNNYDADAGRPVATGREESVYVKNIKPNDVFRATGDAGIAESELFKSREENQRVHNALEDMVENVFNEQYSGIKRRSFSKGRQRYEDIKVRVGVMSRAVDQIDPDVLDFESRFNSAFDLGASGKRIENPYTSWQHNIGDSWDIGLSVFIDGIFLDNLRKLVQADGYQSGYTERHSELGEDILIHHTHGIDEGYFVRRSEFLNMEHQDDVGFFLQSEDEIKEGLLEGYIDIVDMTSEHAGSTVDEKMESPEGSEHFEYSGDGR